MRFRKDARIVVRALERYYRKSRARSRPVIDQRPLAGIVSDLDLAGLAERGGLTGRSLARFIAAYLERTTRLHHPAYLAHQVAVPHPYGSLGSLVDGFTNNAMAIYEMGPAAAAIEYFLINWLLAKVGWPPSPYPGQESPGGNARRRRSDPRRLAGQPDRADRGPQPPGTAGLGNGQSAGPSPARPGRQPLLHRPRRRHPGARPSGGVRPADRRSRRGAAGQAARRLAPSRRGRPAGHRAGGQRLFHGAGAVRPAGGDRRLLRGARPLVPRGR